MKKYALILLALAALLGGCKRKDWMDWKVQNQLWLEQNRLAYADDTTFHISHTGLQYRIKYQGNIHDAKPSSTSTVRCTYQGRLINGAQFDSGNFASFDLSSLVAGFAEGLRQVNVHGDIELYIPYDLGYGEEEQGSEGTQAYIPPYSTLIFNVHLDAVY